MRTRRTVGTATYSPGLEHDAKLYERAFAAPLKSAGEATGVRFETVAISPQWDRNGLASAETLAALRDRLDVIVGLEELGSENMISELQSLQSLSTATRPAPVVIWVPNCEVLDDRSTIKSSKWRATLEALPSGFIDLVIAKMPRREDFLRCIRQAYAQYAARLDERQVVHVPHTCYEEEDRATGNNKKKKYHQKRAIFCTSPDAKSSASSATAAAAAASSAAAPTTAVPAHPPSFFDVSSRNTILHFAGSSPHKNTLENCRAGLELVKQLNAADADANPEAANRPPRFNFTVFLCYWPSKRGEGPPLYAIGLEAYEAIKALAAANADCFNLHAGGFMSYADRRKLYARTRLALCASRAEGFGHYIVEAAASGCLVVTTDGAPMNSLLTVPNTFALAAPRHEERQCYGFAYVVPAESIVSAALTLPLLEGSGYTSAVIASCAENDANTKRQFADGMTRLKHQLAHMVHLAQDKFNRVRNGTSEEVSAMAPARTLETTSTSPPALQPPPTLTPTLNQIPTPSPQPAAFPPMPSVSPPGGTFKKGVFLASSMSPSPSPPVIAPPPGFARTPMHAQQLHAPVPHTNFTGPFASNTNLSGARTGFDQFASLFAAPPPSGPQPIAQAAHAFSHYTSAPLAHVASIRPPPGLNAQTSPETVFRRGTSSLAAIEAQMRAQTQAAQPTTQPMHSPSPPPPPPASQLNATTNQPASLAPHQSPPLPARAVARAPRPPSPPVVQSFEFDHPWLPWPAPT